MNYIYDIYLNLNENPYDFFEWNKTDKLTHIKKIPILIIESNIFKKMLSNNIIIDKQTLNKIENKTETWTVNTKLKYCALFCDYSDIIAIEFDEYGNSIRRSNLYINEENEILEDIKKTKITNIRFKKTKKLQRTFKTRKEIKIDGFINNELKNIDSTKLKYICYECFGSTDYNEDSLNKLKRLKHSSSNYKNLYNILKLTSKGSK